jgi:uncharacterized protein
MIGRSSQIAAMTNALQVQRSSFIALTGRRRVGKTYLIEQVYQNYFCLKVTGIQGAGTQEQINNFMQKLMEVAQLTLIGQPANWQQVFILLKTYLNKLSKRKKQVIFLDELPWMSTNKSGFLQMLAHLWNDYLSKENHFILVVCGSATSWIIQKIVNDKGGLHNRLTEIIQLQPFTLSETKAFFTAKNIKLSNAAMVELYMAFGGIPFYLEKIKKGESVSVALERLCFSGVATFKNEYDNLYKALFDRPENYEAVVAALATVKNGLTREAIIKKANIAAGGPFTRTISDLIISGFVTEELPFGKAKRGSVYRLVDEFSIFYHRFMKNYKKAVKGYWQQQVGTQSYKIWTGYAFENICMKHTDAIKNALGIQNVFTTTASFQQKANNLTPGFQIDFIIDRNDQAINLCECKFYNAPFEIDKKYAAQLLLRKELFKTATGSRKTIFNTMITSQKMVQNMYSLDCVDNAITIDDFM